MFQKKRQLFSNCKRGQYKIGRRVYNFRSLWEANYALFLESIRKAKDIKKWEYEPDTFWFLNIKRGVRSYLPDFKITDNNGKAHYVEVKGWLDPKSKTKLKRMAKYYPDVEIKLFQLKDYKFMLAGNCLEWFTGPIIKKGFATKGRTR